MKRKYNGNENGHSQIYQFPFQIFPFPFFVIFSFPLTESKFFLLMDISVYVSVNHIAQQDIPTSTFTTQRTCCQQYIE